MEKKLWSFLIFDKFMKLGFYTKELEKKIYPQKVECCNKSEISVLNGCMSKEKNQVNLLWC